MFVYLNRMKSLYSAYSATLLLILLFLAGCHTIPKSDSTKAILCSNEYYEALEKSDVAICESVTEIRGTNNPYYDNYCREICIQGIAYKLANPKICKLINTFRYYFF